MLTRVLDAAARRDRRTGSLVGAPFRLLDRSADRLADRVLDVGATLLAVGRTSRWGDRQVALASAMVLLVGMTVASTSAEPPASTVQLTAQTESDVGAPLPADGVEVSPARPEARAVPPEPGDDGSAPPAGERGTRGERWLPTGTGMWLHEWDKTEGGSATAVVERAQAAGLTHLYVQTGSTKKGWIGDEVLSELLPATEGTGLSVIAWDFPKLIDPEDDARRLARAVASTPDGAPRVAAVAPDVETRAEGTRITPHAVLGYYRELRRQLPPDVAVLATVPWPSEKRTNSYPYAETAAHSDAFVPMAYWYNRSPYVVTDTSMQYLAQFGLPVMPVGQGYDGRLDAPYLPEDPDPAGSVQQFVDAARAGGATSISLWSWQTTGGPQWDVLARASAGPWPPLSTGTPSPPSLPPTPVDALAEVVAPVPPDPATPPPLDPSRVLPVP